ncbi:MAG: site-specific integrase [Planctomycetes bacterium]|nr:site-specific integrase [Planctomycetota bacterium]
MAVRKIRGHWWVDFRHDGVRHRKKSPAANKGDAQAYEALLRRRLALGQPLRPEPPRVAPTLRSFSERWLTTYVAANNKPSEQYNKRISLNAHLLPVLGRLRLDQITVQRVEAYKAEKLKQGLAPKTINNHLAALAKCLRCAEEWGEIPSTPRIKLLRVPPTEAAHFEPKESEQLLEAARDPFWRTMILVALRTGLRRSELLALDWADVDLERRVLTVRRALVNGIMGSPKSHKVRHVPLTPDACEALDRLACRRGFVFGRDQGEHPLRKDTAIDVLRRCLDSAGLPRRKRMGWHTLRHTFASQLATNGAPLHVVQALLGHSDIRTTMRYAHLSPSTLAEAVSSLIPAHAQASSPEPRYQFEFGQPVGNAGGIVRQPRTRLAARELAIRLNKAKKQGSSPVASLGSETRTRIEEDEPSEPGEGQPSSADVGRDQGTGDVAA